LKTLKFRTDFCVIAESLHQQRFKFLWDILFDRHPQGQLAKGKWLGKGDAKANVPSSDLLLEMFKAHPTVLLLDEFQTWFDGLTDTPKAKVQTWAYNFIQLLSEIANDNPDLLMLVASIRDNQSQSYQQIHRINPVLVDFQGTQAKHDRQRLLLYRIFENRLNVPSGDIKALINCSRTTVRTAYRGWLKMWTSIDKMRRSLASKCPVEMQKIERDLRKSTVQWQAFRVVSFAEAG
jgi:hypothetical protein